MKDCKGELGRLMEEFGGFCGVGHCETFHLGEDVKELFGREEPDGFRYRIRAGETWRKVNAGR